MLPLIAALRRGKPYQSLEHFSIHDCHTAEPLARLSQVNSGIIRKDLTRINESRDALKQFSCEQLIKICGRAADLFLYETLPLVDGGAGQSPEQYIQTLSATSGLPFVMVRRNMEKLGQALLNMRTILQGLTRGLDLTILDRGYGGPADLPLCFYPVTSCLGLVMPSNSPGVNSLWLPAIPLKIPVILKPGREEPWTPFRLFQAFIAAGCPAEAFGFYPTDHEGAAEILRSCGRAVVFGDQHTTAPYANNPTIQVHGPGHSKILVGNDAIENWPDFIDLMVGSVADNGGRSCVNASTVVVPKYAPEIAEALAQKLGPVSPRAAYDEQATLAAFANPKVAEAIDRQMEEALQSTGARDLTAKYRGGPRLTKFAGAVYLRPTIILCDSFAHPLANREFLCPYASVVQVPQADMLEQIGPSLVVTAITKDAAFHQQLLDSALIQRLNLGPIPTTRISWEQPHEGNLFEFLYQRRALEIA